MPIGHRMSHEIRDIAECRGILHLDGWTGSETECFYAAHTLVENCESDTSIPLNHALECLN